MSLELSNEDLKRLISWGDFCEYEGTMHVNDEVILERLNAELAHRLEVEALNFEDDGCAGGACKL
jgi:hypothetical protein